MTRTDEDLLTEANALAREFYALMGCAAPAGYRFDLASHPQERLCWQMAAVAFERLRQTDIDDLGGDFPGVAP
jgi:hypothetical protein